MGDGILADYMAFLLSFATGKHIIAGMPLNFGEGDTKGRIRNLANWHKPAFWVVLIAVAACIALAVGLLTNPIKDDDADHAEDGYFLMIGDDGIKSIDPDEIQAAIDGTANAWEPGPNSAGLPFEAPVEFLFASGAGGWGTTLTLRPDGSFTGSYSDADMDAGAAGYPNGVRYVSEFAGRFTDIQQISDHAWSMKLMDLTTEQEPGQTWSEDGVLYIAADPHGMTGGEEFILYTPGTPADLIPAECRDWWPDAYRWRNGEIDLLEGWGLCNLKEGIGFYTSWLS